MQYRKERWIMWPRKILVYNAWCNIELKFCFLCSSWNNREIKISICCWIMKSVTKSEEESTANKISRESIFGISVIFILFFSSQRATMYPTIPSDQVRKGSSSIWNPKNASSLQKSPILPPNSLDSSRSDTPRTDSSEGDTTSMWKINFYKNWYNMLAFFAF